MKTKIHDIKEDTTKVKKQKDIKKDLDDLMKRCDKFVDVWNDMPLSMKAQVIVDRKLPIVSNLSDIAKYIRTNFPELLENIDA